MLGVPLYTPIFFFLLFPLSFSARVSLSDIPLDLIRYIYEHNTPREQNCLAHTCKTFLQLSQDIRERSVALASALHLPALQYVPPHEDFVVLEGLEFSPCVRTKIYALRLLARATFCLFTGLPNRELLAQAWSSEMLKLQRQHPEEFLEMIASRGILGREDVLLALNAFTLRFGSVKEALQQFTLFKENGFRVFPLLRALSSSPAVLEYCRKDPKMFPEIYPLLNGHALIQFFSLDVRTEDFIAILEQRSEVKSFVKVLVEFCGMASDELIFAKEAILRSLFKKLLAMRPAKEDIALLFTCLRLRGVFRFDQNKLPLQYHVKAVPSAVMGGHFEYLKHFNQETYNTAAIMSSLTGIKNHHFLAFVRSQDFNTEGEDSFGFLTSSGFILEHGCLMAKVWGFASFSEYMLMAPGDDLDLVFGVFDQYGPTADLEALCIFIQRASADLLQSFVSLYFDRIDGQSENFLVIFRLLMERAGEFFGPLRMTLSIDHFMALAGYSEIRKQIYELKAANKIELLIHPSVLKQVLQSDSKFEIVLANRFVPFRLLWNSQDYQFTPREQTRYLQLTREFAGMYTFRLFSSSSELHHFRGDLFESSLDLFVLALVWWQEDAQSLRRYAGGNQLLTFRELVSPTSEQDFIMLDLLQYMTPDRMEIYRLGLAYLSAFPYLQAQ